MVNALPTPFIFAIAALIVVFMPRAGYLRGFLLLATPILAAVQIWSLGLGDFAPYSFFGFDLEAMFWVGVKVADGLGCYRDQGSALAS